MKNPFLRTANAAPGTEPDEAPTTSRRRRLLPIAAAAVALAVLIGGGTAVALARKSVALDVDGKITHLHTFAGSVAGLLDERGVTVGAHDQVAPGPDTGLHSGDEVVVRTGHRVTINSNGETATVWSTALDADEALAGLAARHADVRLVASRSAVGDRPALPIRLDTNDPVRIVVDGRTRTAPSGSSSVDALLDRAGIVLGDEDRVSVKRDPTTDPAVALVIERVRTTKVTTTTPVAFSTQNKTDATRYRDLPAVVTQEGANGVRTIVKQVVTVDGVTESSKQLADIVTKAPVTKIVVTGTKARPAVAATPKAAPKSQQKPAGGGSSAPAGPPPGGVWAALAQCESGGNPRAVSSNGLYHGLYQFSVSTWRAMGGSGLPSQASSAEQTQRAQALQARSGWGQWPACSRKLGLR